MATLQIQSGNVAKHSHPKTDEIQYIIEGSGAMWLGNERNEFKPGTLISSPRARHTAAPSSRACPVKALAIKIPAAAQDDIHSSTDRLARE